MEGNFPTLYSTGLLVLLCMLNLHPANADTPANCTYENIEGEWTFNLGPGNQGGDIDCTTFDGSKAVNHITVDLRYPDVAVDQFNNTGFWTIIYNQGFEVVVGGRKYFAFSKFAGQKSFCSQTMPGTTHDVLGHDWACYTGTKMSGYQVKVASKSQLSNSLHFGRMINSVELVHSLNSKQSSWTAARYPQWEGMTTDDFVRFAGGKASKIAQRQRARPLTEEQKKSRDSLPDTFDWRNVKGENFVSPVRNQGGCGSCYSFSALAMNEARIRIVTNNTQSPVFSPQDIVDCSRYSQGCDGGFPYLIGGKYAEDYGLVEEKYNPYTGITGKCSTQQKAPRHYSTKYRYVGGFYGACNEAAMMEAVYKNGPVAVGFEVYKDFFAYSGGVYQHKFDDNEFKFSPFELTNHAVLVVGWGKDQSSGLKYWIVKNSWGESWGQQGYFWISRGNDECGIESMAVESFPMLTYNH